MLSSYDLTYPCRRHSAQPTGGVCAACLRERLVKLVCPICGGRRSSYEGTRTCSCPPAASIPKPKEGVVDVGSIGTISSLIEIDIEARKHLLRKETEREAGRSDSKAQGTFNLRKSKSISLSRSNRMVDLDWEGGKAAKKSGLKSLFYRSGSVREFNAVSEKSPLNSMAAALIIGDKMASCKATVVSNHDSSPSTDSSEKEADQVAPDPGNVESLKDDDSRGFPPQAEIAKGNQLFEKETPGSPDLAPVQENSTPAKAIEKGPSPVSVQRPPMNNRLTKSKSIGCARDAARKAAYFWGTPISEKTTPVNRKQRSKLGIFGRAGSSRSSDSFAEAAAKGYHDPDEKRRSSFSVDSPGAKHTILRIQSLIHCRWAVLRGRNGAKEEDPKKKGLSSSMIDLKELEALGDFHSVESSPTSGSISSLISIDSKDKQPQQTAIARTGRSPCRAWSRSLLNPIVRSFRQSGLNKKKSNNGSVAMDLVMMKEERLRSALPISCLVEMDRG